MSLGTDDGFEDIVKVSPPSSSTHLVPSYNDEACVKHEAANGSDISVDAKAYKTNTGNRNKSDKAQDTKPDIPATQSQPNGGDLKSILKDTSDPSTPIKKQIRLVTPQVEPPRAPRQEMNGMIDDTVKRVKLQSDKLQIAAQPYADKTRNFAESRPVLFTFIALWAAFSAIPILIFLGFALIATVVILSTATFFSGMIVIGAILMGGGALIGTLLFGVALLVPVIFITTFLALGTLTTLLGLFLLHRLYLNLSDAAANEGWTTNAIISGVKNWIEETSLRIRSSSPFRRSPFNALYNVKHKHHHHHQHHDSTMSNFRNEHGHDSKSVKGPIRDESQEHEFGGEPKSESPSINRDEKGKYHEHEHPNKGDGEHYGDDDGEDTRSQASTSSASPKTPHGTGAGNGTGTALSEKIGQGDMEEVPKLGHLSEKSIQ
ncbi:uncharacterized protein I303_104552 [Kwoniella dejecticola CBS 10117]|uniref:Uncharacterized protein n=1 Tax=Kwoniella dejecticola CBS 10117 TaxID=1296121 RepID=A0A1A6A4Z7_9TREE|nr:uncharacterized protein I303_04471 [Kwoniella dejecticola CBS 10117]OBR85139.1 hypothetical protein I303_04471 [Kwoniella dejecticola CBS 10117]